MGKAAIPCSYGVGVESKDSFDDEGRYSARISGSFDLRILSRP